MNRLEKLFELAVNRLISGDWEKKVRKVSWITLLALIVTLVTILVTANLKVSLNGISDSLWKFFF